MYKGKRILGLIPARGGSKGLPRKNVLPVGSKPLIGWTIEAARQSELLDRFVLSSDDDEIILTAREFGCEVPFKRDAVLAGDLAGSTEVVLDCLARLPGYDYVVLLQPTSPLRTAEDIDASIRLCLDSYSASCVSVCEAEESPFWMYSLSEKGALSPILHEQYSRRQDLPTIYVLNGAIYVADIIWFETVRGFLSSDTLAYVMPRQRSLDIDTLTDLQLLEKILSERL